MITSRQSCHSDSTTYLHPRSHRSHALNLDLDLQIRRWNLALDLESATTKLLGVDFDSDCTFPWTTIVSPLLHQYYVLQECVRHVHVFFSSDLRPPHLFLRY